MFGLKKRVTIADGEPSMKIRYSGGQMADKNRPVRVCAKRCEPEPEKVRFSV
jgi:hypothetical protein